MRTMGVGKADRSLFRLARDRWRRFGSRAGPRRCQNGFERFREAIEMFAERLRKRIQPMRAGDEILERFCRLNVFDPEGNGVNPFVHRAFDFSLYLGRPVGAGGENQDHDPAGFDRINDRFAPIRARYDVTRGYPAPNAFRLELGDESIGYRFVLGGMTNKNIVGHGDLVSQFRCVIARSIGIGSNPRSETVTGENGSRRAFVQPRRDRGRDFVGRDGAGSLQENREMLRRSSA